jgi:hypothetical protein
MNNIQTDNLIDEIKIDSQGKGWVSIRGTARLSGVRMQTLLDTR